MTKKDVALVVPTIRENCLKDFCERWDRAGLFDIVDLIVMEDNPKRTFEKFSLCKEHLSWEDIAAQLDEKQWIVPRRSDTVRSFAYWWAWSEDYRYIMTLDDDCYPCEDQTGIELVSGHVDAMHNKAKWFNTLNTVKPRGIPFRNLGKRENIVLNHGLWTGVLDYDAPTQLVSPDPEMFDNSSRIVPHGSYFPMCGMNVMWKSEITVWMYHMLMGRIFEPENPMSDSEGLSYLDLDRFGDIWCGIVVKRLCDLMGLEVTTGTPYIRHERASDPFKNLVKEAQGIAINERFWQWIDDFSVDKEQSFEKAYYYMGKHVGEFSDSVYCPEDYRHYFVRLGDAMMEWAELFMEGKHR
jgi:reversibly glycosylated polypeptide/UDP-arabinopyranose mutase